MNELLLIGSVLLIYGGVLLAYRLFGPTGLYVASVLATVFANIEALILIDAFGMEQTLGNIVFASTYLITDILSENHGKKAADRAVALGLFTSAAMLIITQYWFLYTPSASDWATPALHEIFSTTPRMMLASFIGYAASQRFDVWLYHKLWNLTEKSSGSSRAYLWIRNNAATLVSQILNTVIFTVIAFGGRYDTPLLLNVMLTSYVVYIFTSLLDTPAVYLGRWMKAKGWIKEN